MANSNSRVVFLRRKPLTVHEGNKELQDYFSMAHRDIAAYWAKDSMRPGTGLTIAEEDLLLPYVLDIPSTDRDFRSKVTDYYHAISTKVEPGDGTPLEIGLELGNDTPVVSIVAKENGEQGLIFNRPINVVQYIKYRHAISHPDVAESEEAGKGDILKKYFVYDPVAVVKSNNTNLDDKDAALTAYLGVKKNPTKVNQYLILLGVKPENHPNQEAVKLRELAETKPASFMKVHNDKEKDAKSLLLELITAKVLETAGTRYIVVETRDQVAATTKEAVAYMRDPANTKQIAIFKAQLQAWKKKRNINLANVDDEDPGDTTEQVQAGTQKGTVITVTE